MICTILNGYNRAVGAKQSPFGSLDVEVLIFEFRVCDWIRCLFTRHKSHKRLVSVFRSHTHCLSVSQQYSQLFISFRSLFSLSIRLKWCHVIVGTDIALYSGSIYTHNSYNISAYMWLTVYNKHLKPSHTSARLRLSILHFAIQLLLKWENGSNLFTAFQWELRFLWSALTEHSESDTVCLDSALLASKTRN